MAPSKQAVILVPFEGVQLRAVDNGEGTGTLLVEVSDDSANPINGELQLAGPATGVFMDYGTVQAVGRLKSLYLQVGAAPLSWVTTGQVTAQLYAGRAAFAAASGAATQLTAAQVTLGAAQNVGASGTSIAANSLFVFSPATLAELQWPHPYLGVEVKFPSAPTGGVLNAYLEYARF